MSAPELSPEERATVEKFEAAPEPPEILRPCSCWERELICLICGSSCCQRDHEIPF